MVILTSANENFLSVGYVEPHKVAQLLDDNGYSYQHSFDNADENTVNTSHFILNNSEYNPALKVIESDWSVTKVQ